MAVSISLAGVLRPYAADEATVVVPAERAETIGAVLDALAERHPALDRRLRDESGALRRYVNFYVDGEECRRLAGADTPVPDGSEILILPSVAGG
ncbi:ubiquitin-like small modifier protein 1 [Cryptosporangium aurantiacum]|uniref:Molybdopterin synthase subunit MoaD n=1 Tax=Cryptosporangium aurantiacum TaxID=134849 RepID=A0A1M7RLY2_9ACTN|nr:ubiquitin-like small modifier protein 1 [Cryptosporangium aurantiacum]SHN47327.1 molybdopterin synthase subunit MoaD [Cryptosporangium aurantiacum]